VYEGVCHFAVLLAGGYGWAVFVTGMTGDKIACPTRGVEMSLDTARKSACATKHLSGMRRKAERTLKRPLQAEALL
jgi:hypothetical protein